MGLLQMSLSGAVMIAAIVIIRMLAINRLPKRTFLILWGIVVLRLLVPFSVPSAFSIYSLAEQHGIGILPGQISARYNGALTGGREGCSYNDEKRNSRLTSDGSEYEIAGQETDKSKYKASINENDSFKQEEAGRKTDSNVILNTADNTNIILNATDTANIKTDTDAILNATDTTYVKTDTNVSFGQLLQKQLQYIQSGFQHAKPLYQIIWCAGMLLCIGYFAVSYLRCRFEFQTSLPVDNTFVQDWLQEYMRKHLTPAWFRQNVHVQKWLDAYSRHLSVRQADRVSTPLTYGLIRPVILMPKNTDWENRQQLRYVLLHEYVHIRRLDALTKLLVTCALCVHWFNPMVWLMWILFNRDVEISCDECVVRHMGESSRSAYAMLLIQMEAERSGIAPLCSGLLFKIGKNAMEERITAIMKMKKKSLPAVLAAAVLVISVTAVFSTSAAESKNKGRLDNQKAVIASGDLDKVSTLNDKEEWIKERRDEWDKMVEEIERRKVVKDELLPAENLRWCDEIPGMAVFYNPNRRVRFVLHCFKDGQEERTWDSFAWINEEVMVPVYGEIFESGTYTFQVEMFAYDAETDYDLTSGCISEMSSEFVYTRPAAQLSAPDDIQLSSEGVLSWSDVDHADSYWCYLYRSDKNADDSAYHVMGGDERHVTNIDYKERLEEGYQYYCTVRAISQNINLYANSMESAYISLYYYNPHEIP